MAKRIIYTPNHGSGWSTWGPATRHPKVAVFLATYEWLADIIEGKDDDVEGCVADLREFLRDEGLDPYEVIYYTEDLEKRLENDELAVYEGEEGLFYEITEFDGQETVRLLHSSGTIA